MSESTTKPAKAPVRKPVTPKERPAREALTKEQRQAVKLLIQRPDERRLLDKLLEGALEANALSTHENDTANKLLERSRARRWEARS